MPPQRSLSFSVPWNLCLITLGAALTGVGIKAIAMPQGFFSGGVAGLSVLCYYFTDRWDPGLWYIALNAPLFIMSWVFVSKRFFAYSMFGMLVLAAVISQVKFNIPIKEPMLAAFAGGACIGGGCGIVLRSLGSQGGTDILAVILNQKWNLRIGTISFLFNALVFGFALTFVETDRILFTLTMVFISNVMLEYVLGMFNQSKMALIITDKPDEIMEAILTQLHRGATFIHAEGGYSHKPKKIILTVVKNIQLKRLEELVFHIDPMAFTVLDQTLNVLGKGFSQRKVY
jgi:uncharacterized membrane-anchored protein YitT (DUF2179 family)